VRVRLLLAIGALVVGLAAVSAAFVIKSGRTEQHPPPPATASPQLVAYLQRAQPLPRASSNPAQPTNLGPLVQSFNQSWSSYFGAAPGKPVVAVKGWGSAGVGMLDRGDAVYPMCGKDVKFNPTASIIVYCQEPFLARGQNLHSGNILVPYQPFTAAVGQVIDPVQAQLDVSLVVAFFYTSHLRAGLGAQQLAAWQDGAAGQMCLAGVGVATLIPQAPTARQWMAALGFLHQFWHYPQQPWQATDLLKGYQTADPKSCFAGA